MKAGDGTVITFTVEANAAFAFTFANSDSARSMAIYIGGVQVGAPVTVDGATHRVTLTRGTCKLVVVGGEVQISKLSLTY